MPELLLTLAGAVATLAAACSLGLTLDHRRELTWPAIFGVGSAALSSAIFLLMAAGWASRPILLLVLSFSALPLLLRPGRLPPPALPPLWFIVAMAPFAVLYGVHALAPEVEADPNIYHLLPAVEALRSGGFGTEISFHNRLPHGLEMLFIPAFAIGGSASAKLIHFAFLIATLPLIAAVAQSLGLPRVRGWLAAGFYFVTPVVAISGTSAFNDAGSAFFALLTFYLLLASAPVSCAGIAAGFAYAVKMTGALPLVAGSIWLLLKSRFNFSRFNFSRFNFRQNWLFFASAALVAGPWVARNWVETGNPFAPFANSWFANDYFPADMDGFIRSNLSAYGGVKPMDAPLELAFGGHRLQGLLGPVFLLLPLALLAARSRAGRYLLAAAVVLTLPWFFNPGARFLMPSLPFWLLAFVAALPVRLAAPILCLHAVLSWPFVLITYAPSAWCLRGFPWEAAFRVRTEEQYLEVRSWDYRLAQTMNSAVPAGARIFDLYGAQGRFLERPLTGSWQSGRGRRIFAAMVRALDGLALYQTGTVPVQPWTGLRVHPPRVQPPSDGPGRDWCVHEITTAGRPTLNVTSSLRRPEVMLAFDGNPLSAGCTWRAAAATDFLEATVEGVPLTAPVRIWAQSPVEMETRDVKGVWGPLPSSSERLPLINLRSFAGKLLAGEGMRYVIVPVNNTTIGRLGTSLVDNAADWGLEAIANHDHVYLLKVISNRK